MVIIGPKILNLDRDTSIIESVRLIFGMHFFEHYIGPLEAYGVVADSVSILKTERSVHEISNTTILEAAKLVMDIAENVLGPVSSKHLTS